MKGYDNANGDSRGILERFLPTIFRKSTDGTPTHNAILGSIKQSIETTRDELASMSYEVYFTKATGKFLDLYGKYIGLDRLELEDDDTYRGRLLSYVKTQRGTISAIVEGIQSELGKDVNVNVYETWRNIFILNKSNLNGLDYIMGNKYRYGVIEITLDTYVDNNVLQGIVNKYKSHGVLVYYRYSLGGTGNVWDLMVDNTENYYLDGDAVIVYKQQVFFKNMKTYLADSPITVEDLKLFKNNVSKINGSDVLSGNPSNAYIYDKTKSPYFHLIGYVPDNVSIDSYQDVYDYVYKNNMIIPGGRNYILNSSGINASPTNRPSFRPNGAGASNANSIVSYNSDSMTLTYTSSGTAEWYYALAESWQNFSDVNIDKSKQYTISVDVKGTAPAVLFRGNSIVVSKAFDINNTDWTRIVYTFNFADSSGKFFLRLNAASTNGINGPFTTGQTLSFRNFKLEIGNESTDWSPAPEDNDHSMDVYRFGTEPYIRLSKEDTNAYTFTPDTGSSPVFSFNMSRILANNGYNDQVKNFSSNQVTEIGIHTKGSETGLPNTTVTAKGNTGAPISGSFQDTNPNKLFNTEFVPGSGGLFPGWKNARDPYIVSGTYNDSTRILNTSTTPGNRLYADLVYVKDTPVISFSVYNDNWMMVRAYDQNKVFMREIYSLSRSSFGLNKRENFSVPQDVYYVEFGFQSSVGGYVAQPMLTFSSTLPDYVPGYYNQADKDIRLQYVLSSNSSGDYTYNLSTPSQVSTVSIDDYYPYGRSKRVITASGAGTTVPLGIFDTQTTPTMTVPNYATLNKDTITRYVDSVYVNTDVPLSALRIYNFTTQRWESVPAGRFNVGNYLKDSISIPGSYLLIKSTVNTIKYLDIDVTLLNLGVTQ